MLKFVLDLTFYHIIDKPFWTNLRHSITREKKLHTRSSQNTTIMKKKIIPYLYA